MTDEGTQTRVEQSMSSLTDPDALRDRADVAVEERERPMPDEKFEALRERYDAIAGVVQVGLTHDGEALLWGEEDAAPPGESVGDGEDWAETARDAMADLTGRQVRIDAPLMLEVTYFHREGDADERFPARSVHFAASLVDPGPEWVADPEAPADYENPMFEGTPELDWYDSTDGVDENHAHHVERYLD